ncbi:MAG TPA: hypothetical protein VK968_07120, partial [Roseimicrobium sp.]|nr:hypothetical protein [Roseimicrobium sp.]
MTRRTIKSPFATIELLENRQLLSADTGTTGQLISPAVVGINLNVNDTWRTSALWVDTANLLSRWGKFNVPANVNPSLTYTADGYPLQSASAWMQLKGYPDGVYKLSFDGAATVTISSMGSIVAGSMVTVGNTTTADV